TTAAGCRRAAQYRLVVALLVEAAEPARPSTTVPPRLPSPPRVLPGSLAGKSDCPAGNRTEIASRAQENPNLRVEDAARRALVPRRKATWPAPQSPASPCPRNA